LSSQSTSNRAPRILVTGFGRFPGAPVNPTALLVRRLARLRRPALAGHAIVAHVFPTSYAAVDRQLAKLIAQLQPDAIVMFGLAGRSDALRVETVARNRTLRVFPDADGSVPKRATIEHGGETMRGQAPLAKLAAAIRATGLPVRLSADAGRYVCNYTYWRGLEAAQKPGGPAVVVFVHVPALRGRRYVGGKSPRPTYAQLLRAAQAIVVAAAAAARRYNHALSLAEGRISPTTVPRQLRTGGRA
jgi:pyroglutamyl-peptidase